MWFSPSGRDSCSGPVTQTTGTRAKRGGLGRQVDPIADHSRSHRPLLSLPGKRARLLGAGPCWTDGWPDTGAPPRPLPRGDPTHRTKPGTEAPRALGCCRALPGWPCCHRPQWLAAAARQTRRPPHARVGGPTSRARLRSLDARGQTHVLTHGRLQRSPLPPSRGWKPAVPLGLHSPHPSGRGHAIGRQWGMMRVSLLGRGLAPTDSTPRLCTDRGRRLRPSRALDRVLGELRTPQRGPRGSDRRAGASPGGSGPGGRAAPADRGPSARAGGWRGRAAAWPLTPLSHLGTRARTVRGVSTRDQQEPGVSKACGPRVMALPVPTLGRTLSLPASGRLGVPTPQEAALLGLLPNPKRAALSCSYRRGAASAPP